MPLASDLMGAGLSSGTARAMSGRINTAVSAAGTGQSDATALVSSVNSVTTVAANSGVRLPACDLGGDVWVYNGQVTNALKVYPDTGAAINQLSANTAVSLAPYSGALFKRVTSTAWLAILSA